MTATALFITQAEAEWIKIFPKQVTENYTSSVTFMKQLTVVAVSKIVYMKNAFPEDSYTTETFGGCKLRILKKKCRNDNAQYLSTALVQAFEAFDKKYLEKLALCFYEDECKLENLIEYHVFEYSYHSDGVTMNVHSKTKKNTEQTLKCTLDDVKEKTIDLIRAYTVINQSCQQELPPCYDFSVRLYYNKDAPENYQAPGYSICEGEQEDHLAPSVHDTIKIGCVETPFHKLAAKSYFKYNLKASHEAIVNNRCPLLDISLHRGKISATIHHAGSLSVGGESEPRLLISKLNEQASPNPPMMTQEVDVTQDFTWFIAETPRAESAARFESVFRCPCNKYDVGELCQLMGVLTCFYCKTRQHAACYGVLAELAPQVLRHCCASCADESLRSDKGTGAGCSRTPTDVQLATRNLWQREYLCMLRRTLVWCSARGSVSGTALQTLGASLPNARRLLRLLCSYSVIADDDTEEPQRVNRAKLNFMMEQFFKNTGNNDIVDQLLEETFASQESRHDPVGEVLNPMEKITLRNAAYPGQMLEPAKPQHAVKDPTLQQYEEALLSSEREEEEIPLLEVLKKEKLGKRKVYEAKKVAPKAGVKTKRARFTLK